MSLLVIETIPKSTKADEGIILYKFLEMIELRPIKLVRFQGNRKLIKFLSEPKNLRNYDFIHISGHGKVNEDENQF